ncbi:hypothetical protein BGZ94_000457 [Podila epigama]|nr:hypothetical protein BGZ94_000457 [Podila epigama]
MPTLVTFAPVCIAAGANDVYAIAEGGKNGMAILKHDNRKDLKISSLLTQWKVMSTVKNDVVKEAAWNLESEVRSSVSCIVEQSGVFTFRGDKEETLVRFNPGARPKEDMDVCNIDRVLGEWSVAKVHPKLDQGPKIYAKSIMFIAQGANFNEYPYIAYFKNTKSSPDQAAFAFTPLSAFNPDVQQTVEDFSSVNLVPYHCSCIHLHTL